MIKRLGKAKKKKQGAILVIVVVILALAMIFISMAMLLTKATRNRLYENAMSSQARLTVTSAAETFLEALQTQEITDKQMDGFLSESPTKADGEMYMVIDGVPGMTQADDNCTILNIYYPDKTSKPNVVYCDFSTTIGDQTENVRVELSIQPQDETKPSDRFSNQIDQYSTLGDSTLFFEGGIGAVRDSELKPTDNTVLLRNGNATTTASGVKFYSDVVFADGATFTGDSASYFGDLIFLGDAFVQSHKSLDSDFEGNVFFVGSTETLKPGFKINAGQPGVQEANLWGRFKPKNIVFDKGRSVTADDKSSYIANTVNRTGTTCYFVGRSTGEIKDAALAKDANGTAFTVTNAGGLGDLQTKFDTVSKYDYTSTGNAFPTDIVDEVFKKMNPDGEVMVAGPDTQLSYDTFSADGTKTYSHTKKIPEGEKYIVNPLTQYYPAYKKDSEGKIPSGNVITLSGTGDLSTRDKEDGTIDMVIDLDPGYYYLKPNSSGAGQVITTTDNGLKPYVIAIDGSRGGDYRFYFAPGTYELNCCVFAIYNPSNLEPVIFILEPGAQVNWGGKDNKWANTSALCTSGIISIDRGITGVGVENKAHAIGDYIQTTSMSTEAGSATGKFAYSTFYDGKVKPSAYLFGSCVGTDTYIDYGATNAIFEAYIGMYGSKSYVSTHDGNNPVWIYGRIETYNVLNYNTSCHNAYMPYCPGPQNNGEPLPDERPAETKYKVAAITYYYGTGIPEGT